MNKGLRRSGWTLIYVISTQAAAGLTALFGAAAKLELDDCIVVGMPLILVTIVAFLPFPVIQSFPVLIRPVAGNGFVMGVISALFLEHELFRR